MLCYNAINNPIWNGNVQKREWEGEWMGKKIDNRRHRMSTAMFTSGRTLLSKQTDKQLSDSFHFRMALKWSISTEFVYHSNWLEYIYINTQHINMIGSVFSVITKSLYAKHVRRYWRRDLFISLSSIRDTFDLGDIETGTQRKIVGTMTPVRQRAKKSHDRMVMIWLFRDISGTNFTFHLPWSEASRVYDYSDIL